MTMTYHTLLPVNIEHINYGGHLAHDKLITMMHEARLRFFDSFGQSEVDFFEIGLILKSLSVDYAAEAFRGDQLTFRICVSEVRGSAFTLDYHITNEEGETIANAQLVQVGFDYENRRITRLPAPARQALAQQTTEQC